MATILSLGRKTIKTDLEEVFDALQDERANLLGTTRELQLGAQLLGAIEAQRLVRKVGADDPRVLALAARNTTILERVGAIDVERELAMVRTPPVAKTETLVHGRITDERMLAAGRMSVALVDERGQAVAGVGPVETDDAGYYAFVLKPEQVQAIGAGRKLTVLVRRDDVTIAPAATQPFTLASGAVAVNEFKLNGAELDKLKLRPVFKATGAPVAPGPARAAKRRPKAPSAKPASRRTVKPRKPTRNK